MRILVAFKTVCFAAAGILALAVAPASAVAQNFPNQTMRFVVPFPPGGGLDAVARMLAPELQKSMGQTVVVENKAGGSGFIGTMTVTKAKPDGHTFMIQALGMSMNPSIYKNLPYDPIKELEPVAMIASVPVVLAVGNHVKANNLKELIALAKAKPGAIKGGAFVTGSATVMFEMFKLQSGTDIHVINYRGVGPALAAVTSGEADFVIMDGGSVIGQIKSGRVRGIAVAADKRIEEIGDIPTTAEAGLPDFKIEFWYAAFTTGGTPAPIVERLNAEMNKAANNPEVAAKLRGLGMNPGNGSAADFTARHHREMKEWAEVVKRSGFVPLEAN
jgi:tripartite-type tricarboxylate transporter receptor subunit TctC